MEYLEGDPRFKKIKKNEREIVNLFARKEYKNLEICERAGVSSPKPIYTEKNIVVMGFIGKDGKPFPTLEKKGFQNQKIGREFLNETIEEILKMYKNNLIHADLSEYNILVGNKKVYIIDLGQGVVLDHPKSKEFLARDIKNILRYFTKKGVIDEKESKKIKAKVMESINQAKTIKDG